MKYKYSLELFHSSWLSSLGELALHIDEDLMDVYLVDIAEISYKNVWELCKFATVRINER